MKFRRGYQTNEKLTRDDLKLKNYRILNVPPSSKNEIGILEICGVPA